MLKIFVISWGIWFWNNDKGFAMYTGKRVDELVFLKGH